MSKPADLVQGTLDLLILKILAFEPLRGWVIGQRLKQVSGDVLQVSDGSLYPALHKLEQVDAVLIRPLPYVDAGRLVMIWDEMSYIGFPKHNSTPAEWREWRQNNTVFTDIAATQPVQAILSSDGEPEEAPARKVTANLWTVLFRPDYLPTVAVACLILLAVAALASFVPARRAANVDPLVVLRNE